MSGMRTGARRSHSLSAQSVEADNRSASLARTDHTAPECASTTLGIKVMPSSAQSEAVSKKDSLKFSMLL